MTAEKNTIAGRLWFNTKADATTETYVITLWPYRSLSLRGFRIFMAVLASLMIGDKFQASASGYYSDCYFVDG